MTVTQTASKATKTAKKTATAKASASAADTPKQKPAAFIFGERPSTITGPVAFTSVSGQEVDMECTFVYRTRAEFAQFWDEVQQTKVEEFGEGEEFTQKKLTDRLHNLLADRALMYLKAWPLEIELSHENLVALFDQEPSAPAAFFNAYQLACQYGRQGNSKPQ